MNFGSPDGLHIQHVTETLGKLNRTRAKPSEALPVHNRWARLVVLSLGDPHLLESAQGREDRAANPHRVFALRWCHNLDLHGRRGQGRKLLGHALTDACEHSSTT